MVEEVCLLVHGCWVGFGFPLVLGGVNRHAAGMSIEYVPFDSCYVALHMEPFSKHRCAVTFKFAKKKGFLERRL